MKMSGVKEIFTTKNMLSYKISQYIFTNLGGLHIKITVPGILSDFWIRNASQLKIYMVKCLSSGFSTPYFMDMTDDWHN
jgi:hypothetical protein